jgi:SAM-dependent methyltransferase/uncharacterized protein YbaR (Trm112 family)
MANDPKCLAVLRCPQCGGELASEGGLHLRCVGCTRTYPVTGGIPSLALNAAYYYGEIPQSEMRRMLDRVRAVGLEDGLRDAMQTAKNPDYFIDYAMRDGRAGWMFYLPIRPRARILDIGCGPGSLSISLARHGHEVFGVDLTLERVQFLMLRARELGLDNICAIHGGDGSHWPFSDGAFDLVILNGVLEWLAHGSSDRSPRAVQLRFLGEAARVLRRDGHVFVGIENRYGKDYFFGKLEEHARLPYVSLFPRWIADLYARARSGQPYRTWTYSSRGLSALLRQAGFRRRRLLLPIPDYREYYRIVDGESKASINTYLGESKKKRLVRMLGGATLIRHLAPSFGMVGSKTPAQFSTWLLRLAQHVPALNHSIVEKYLVTATDTVVARLRTPENAFIVRVPLNPAAHEACVNNETVTKHINQVWLPRPAASGQFEGSHYFIENVLPGGPISTAMIPSATEFLLTLRSVPVAARSLDEYLRSVTARLLPFFNEPSALSDLSSYVVEQISNRKLPPVLTHGDYWRGNILADRGRITGLVDWSHAVFGVPSISDALHLLVFERSETRHITIVDAVRPFIAGTMEEREKRPLDKFAAAMHIDLDFGLRNAFASLYWLEYLAQRLGRTQNRYVLNPRWLATHVTEAGGELVKAIGLRPAIKRA